MASATTPPGDPTDVVRRRAAAFLIDAVLLGVIGLVVFAALRYRAYSNVRVDACTVLRRGVDSPICLKIGSRVFLWHPGAAKTAVLVTLFFALMNGVVLQTITGSTVGKLCLRLSVVNENGGKPHPLRILGRWLFLVVDLGFCLVGCFMVPATHPHRRIGDFVFGTYVVAMMSVGRPVVVDASNAVDPGSLPGVGSPSAWSAPPAPSPAKTALAAATAGLSPPLKTPPGTTPTVPGEWGAVARPAPVVRSPQWASPPPSDGEPPPVVIESATSPKWAAPPVFDDEPETVPDAPKDEAEPEVDEAADVEADVEADEAEAEVVETEVDETQVEDLAEEVEAGTETNSESEADTPPAQAASEVEGGPEAKDPAEPEPAVEVDDVAEPETEAEIELESEASTEAAPDTGVSDAEENEEEADPELSEWSAVAASAQRRKERRNRAANAAGSGSDESWWDAALSSGDSDSEADES